MRRSAYGLVLVTLATLAGVVWPTAGAARQPPAALANECIVKVQLKQPACLHCLFERHDLFQDATGSVSLDVLNAQYRLAVVERLFRSEGSGPLSLEGQDTDQAIVNALAKFPTRLSRGIGIEQLDELPSFSQVYRFRFADGVDAREACAAYAEDGAVVYAHLNYFIDAPAVRPQPVTLAPLQQALEQAVGTFDETPLRRGPLGRSVILAVLDSGLGTPSIPVTLHPRGWDMTTCDTYTPDGRCADPKARDSQPRDAHGHGTRVAEAMQTVLARVKFTAGSEGPPIVVLPVQVLNGQGEGVLSNAVSGIIYAAVQGADVIYLGWQTKQPIPEVKLLQEAMELASAMGVLLVSPAGDQRLDLNAAGLGLMPMSSKEVLAVAATDPSGTLLPASNHGAHVELTAPGFSWLEARSQSAHPRAKLAAGSSYAAAYVAAAAAVRLAVSPEWSLYELRSTLRATADRDQGTRGRGHGYGQLNLSRLAQWKRPLGVQLLNPEQLSVVGGWVDIGGLVQSPEAVTYELSYGPGDDPSAWTSLTTSTIDPPEFRGIVGDWLTNGVPNGMYTIRLSVSQPDGTTFEDRRLIRVENGTASAER